MSTCAASAKAHAFKEWELSSDQSVNPVVYPSTTQPLRKGQPRLQAPSAVPTLITHPEHALLDAVAISTPYGFDIVVPLTDHVRNGVSKSENTIDS